MKNVTDVCFLRHQCNWYSTKLKHLLYIHTLLGLLTDGAIALSEEGEVLAASASVWPWGIPNLLNRFLPNVLGVWALLFGTSAVSTSSKFSSSMSDIILCVYYTSVYYTIFNTVCHNSKFKLLLTWNFTS